MAAYAMAMPVLPGKAEALRRLSAEVSGPRRGEHVELLRRAGMTNHLVWLQQTPQGDVEIVYWEGADPARMLQTLASAGDPHGRWFKDQMKDIFGWDLTQPGPAPSIALLFEWRAT